MPRLEQALQFGFSGGIDVGYAYPLLGDGCYAASNLQVFRKSSRPSRHFHYGQFVPDLQLNLFAGLLLHSDDGQSRAVCLYVGDSA